MISSYCGLFGFSWEQLRYAIGKKRLEDLRSEIRFGWLLKRPNRKRVRIIVAGQFFLDGADCVLLDQKKIAIDFGRHVVAFVITDGVKVAEDRSEEHTS